MEAKSHLFIISKCPQGDFRFFIPDQLAETAVILIQDAVQFKQFSSEFVYVLKEDVIHRKIDSPFSTISYSEMLNMILHSENVVVI